VEAVNLVSAGVTRDHWRDVEVALDAGARWRGYGSELARLYEVVSASEGRVRVLLVDPPTGEAPGITSQPSVTSGAAELEAPVDAYLELEI
jgi:hypothetical protein